jgi:hypothetical protein
MGFQSLPTPHLQLILHQLPCRGVVGTKCVTSETCKVAVFLWLCGLLGITGCQWEHCS